MPSKKQRIHFDLSPEAVALIKRKSKAQGMSMSSYVDNLIKGNNQLILMLERDYYDRLQSDPSASFILNNLLAEFFRLLDAGKIQLPRTQLSVQQPQSS